MPTISATPLRAPYALSSTTLASLGTNRATPLRAPYALSSTDLGSRAVAPRLYRHVPSPCALYYGEAAQRTRRYRRGRRCPWYKSPP
eukprot:811769-Rhodomonas_salina.2